MSTNENNSQVVNLYQAHQKIYPREVKGIFQNLRWICIWITQLVFFLVPWLTWDSRQALLFDLAARRFYIFNIILYPQDLIYLTILLIICALSLFLFTAVAGRLWCGYACPQTVYTEIFQWIERKFEGGFLSQQKLDQSSWGIKKTTIKGGKFLTWGIFSLWTGFTFSGFFTPIRPLFDEFINLSLSGWSFFWIIFYSIATFGNAGFLREQVCKYMCPYARFQSAMFDRDTLIISYDEARGEPRGKLDAKNKGDCIDCNICVQVCPTGIDIRNGLQYECIGCAACIDACDTVMEKIGKPKGLVRYTSETLLNNERKSFYQNIFRPRVIIYTIVLWSLILGLFYSLNQRNSFRVDIVKDRSVLSRLDQDGHVENIYRFQMMNLIEENQTFKIYVSGIEGIQLDEADQTKTITLNPAQSEWYVFHAEMDYEKAPEGKHKIFFTIESNETHDIVKEKSTFIVPKRR